MSGEPIWSDVSVIAGMGEQIKAAWKKLKEYWSSLPPKRRHTILTAFIAIVVLALGLVVFLNFSGASMVLLYEGLDSGESVEIYNALQEIGIAARLNGSSQVEVRRQDKDRAIGQLAMQNYPKSALPYKYPSGESGLTTTDRERRQYELQGLQDRMQDTIRQYEGVKNVVVTIDMPQDTNYPWSGSTQTASGSVSLVLQPGYTPTPDQVSGIKYLVSKSVGQGMTPADVVVIDSATWVNLKSRDDANAGGTGDESERLLLQEQVEQKLGDKVRNVLSIAFAPENIRVSATVAMDYKKVMTESKEYTPSEDSPNNTGVLNHQDKQYTMDANQLAQGVAGEEDNTDGAPVYVDQDGDGVPETVDYAMNQDFAVSYVKQQIQKDNAELVSASIAIMVKGALAASERTALIELASKATGVAEEDISLQSVDSGIVDEPQGTQVPDLTTMLPYFAAIAGLIVLLLIIMIVAGRRGKKNKKNKKSTKAAAQQQAEREEVPVRDTTEDDLLWQQELDEHKRQLQEAAKVNQKEDAIVTEVREFAQENPEITAGLLRAWLKEEEE